MQMLRCFSPVGWERMGKIQPVHCLVLQFKLQFLMGRGAFSRFGAFSVPLHMDKVVFFLSLPHLVISDSLARRAPQSAKLHGTTDQKL